MNRRGAGSALHEAVAKLCSASCQCAADEGYLVACMQRLLDAGADPFLENIDGHTAVQVGNIEALVVNQ